MKSYLIDSVKRIVNSYNGKDINPSLYLDKFIGPVDEKDAKVELKKVTELNSIYNPKSRDNVLKNLPGFEQKKFKTNSPFTLHLSGNSVLENAGICLHPVYGCVYIPGSGIKGLARHYAEQVWLKSNETEENKKLIIDIFGNENTEKKHENLRAGKIVFHDAFPEKAENILEVSINNCHHQDYYTSEGKNPPGDWENPVPTYYLNVKMGTTFIFSISLRQDIKVEEDKGKLLSNTWEILVGALANFGIGAKTSSGFGIFTETDKNGIKLDENANDVFKIELTSPAFFAKTELEKEYNSNGYDLTSEQSECDLTVPTLRGQLRWWWRTIYSYYLPYPDLYKLESLIWGGLKNESAVKIIIQKNHNLDPKLLRNQQDSKDSITYKNLEYLYYGMNNRINITVNGQQIKKRKTRYYLPEGAQWTIKFDCKDVKDGNILITKNEVLNEAKKALFLLTTYGGVGAKSGKGFGSINLSKKMDFEINDLPNKEIIKKLNIGKSIEDNKMLPVPSLNFIKKLDNPLVVGKESPFEVLNYIGKIYFRFCNDEHKHEPIKKVLGLPRDIKAFGYNPLEENTELYKYVERHKISNNKDIRKSSPIHFHISKINNSKYKIELLCFKENSVTNNSKDVNDIIDKFVNFFP
ncbi:MAG: type III-B CRISPR module RAMP protein Cmr6 [Elusimicrobiales bacterium]|nr:type III-B CRISPR module RAMP protein Cmr6 [Elusimicrobiales bacterium]